MSKFEDKFVAIGKVFPVQPRNKSTPPKGLKPCLFQDGSDKLVDFGTGYIIWRRDAEDILNGRKDWAFIYRGVEQEKPVEVPVSIKPNVKSR